MTLLASYAKDDRNVSDKSGSNFAPAVFAVSPYRNGVTKKQFTEAMNRLFAAGKIKVQKVGSLSRQVRSIVPLDAQM